MRCGFDMHPIKLLHSAPPFPRWHLLMNKPKSIVIFMKQPPTLSQSFSVSQPTSFSRFIINWNIGAISVHRVDKITCAICQVFLSFNQLSTYHHPPLPTSVVQILQLSGKLLMAPSRGAECGEQNGIEYLPSAVLHSLPLALRIPFSALSPVEIGPECGCPGMDLSESQIWKWKDENRTIINSCTSACAPGPSSSSSSPRRWMVHCIWNISKFRWR